jgi:CheY-like chemotaxis protein
MMNIVKAAVMPTKRLLVIDDEAHIREVIQTSLEIYADWEILPISSAQQGLIQAEREQPDAIILDVTMPVTDGFTFLQQLRTNPATQSIPVVLLTAEPYWDNSLLTTLGVAAVLTKPFNPLTLANEITVALGW